MGRESGPFARSATGEVRLDTRVVTGIWDWVSKRGNQGKGVRKQADEKQQIFMRPIRI